jgi:hypothetical protein
MSAEWEVVSPAGLGPLGPRRPVGPARLRVRRMRVRPAPFVWALSIPAVRADPGRMTEPRQSGFLSHSAQSTPLGKIKN